MLRSLLGFMFFLTLTAGSKAQTSDDFPDGEPFVYTRWESFTKESTNGGLLNDHIFAVRADGDSLWIGSEGGLNLYYNGTWQGWTEADGLPWRVVIGIDKDPRTGDLWLALFGEGIARFSGGRFEHFTQMNSGLLNDVTYAISVEGDHVWVATTGGASRYNYVEDSWTLFNEQNSPMEEVWNYHVSAYPDKVFLAVWGSGILEYDVATGEWSDYLDPDGEMEIDLYRDDGLVHVITTSASYREGVLWASTYFGLSRYDGRNWKSYSDHDSGLASTFINFTKARDGNSTYNCTDKGLAGIIDFPTDTWVTYRQENEEDPTWTAFISRDGKVLKQVPTNLDLPNHFAITFDYQGKDIWVGTGHGLARGIGNGFYAGLRAPEPAGRIGQTGSR